ncbi:hypothetical protein ACQUEF_11740 [Vagococcus fluvialis]|uniref:hypothetical protein n=1 Tax=Vagococcus fluvialis TaxID=2738 RepID=UPI003D0E5DDE
MKTKENKWDIPEIKEEYKIENFRPLTIKERLEIYSRLNKQQRNLIDDHRKFLIRSEFLKDSYLKASDWEFVDLKIDEKYPDVHKKEHMLYCECGRRLKYQYIVKSKEKQTLMTLGIQHFKDHLNIPQQVATEITQRLNNVDFALDELLWLKRLGIEFPKELWENYAFFIYANQFSNSQLSLNLNLARRVSDFKEVDMPIYISDYQAVLKEIERLKKGQEKINHELFNQDNFQKFQSSLPSIINQETLFNQASIWSSAIQKRLKTHPEKPQLPKKYFEELFSILQLDREKREKELNLFANRGMGKWIQKEVYEHLLNMVNAYGLEEVFLNQIHPFMREGLTGFLSENKLQKETEVNESLREIETILNTLDKTAQETILKKLQETIL